MSQVRWGHHVSRTAGILPTRSCVEFASIHYMPDRLLSTLGPRPQPPKLTWLKRHLPDSWQRARKAMDLADFMVYMASGNDVRSVCTVGCKWSYLAHEERWDRDMYTAMGIADALDRGLCGTVVLPLGSSAGKVSARAAQHLGISGEMKRLVKDD